jgi:hypothetical protein
MRTETESCDGKDLGGQTCSSLGFYGQTTGLTCAVGCTFDTSGCAGRCGDGQINGPDEQCDGFPPVGKTCLDYGFDRGFLACNDRCTVTTAGCDHFGWQVADIDQGKAFSGIWGSSDSDIYAVGPDTGIVHWDGTSWSPVVVDPNVAGFALPTFGCVWGSGPSDVWFAGSYRVFHWDGVSWSAPFSATSPPTGIWGSGPNDVFFVGNGVVTHWDGAKASNITPQNPFGINSVWGTASDNVYVFGQKGQMLRWDGSAWHVIVLSDTLATTSIWGRSANDVYAVGFDETNGGSFAFHFDGSSWAPTTDLPQNTGLVWGSDAQDVFALVGGFGTDTLFYRAGDAFAPVEKFSFNAPYFGMLGITHAWGLDSADTYFAMQPIAPAGPNQVSGLIQPGPAAWLDADQAYAYSVWGSGDEVFVASRGFLLELPKNGPAVRWPYPPGSPSPARIWGSSRDDLWGVSIVSPGAGFTPTAPGQILHWNGSAWADVGVSPRVFLDIVGSGPKDIWVAGETTHWDGAHWSFAYPQLSAIWARSPTDAFGVDGSGTIQHWDGRAWSPMTSGTSSSLFSVWGVGPDEVFATGARGTILHYGKDRQWTPMLTRTTDSLGLIRGSSPGNVFVAGYVGTGGPAQHPDVIYHLRAGAWEPINGPIGLTARNDIPLWVTPRSVYFGLESGTSPASTHRLDLKGVDCVAPERSCNDGWDNDCDGLTDAADPDCAGKVTEQCANLVDDDANGLIDCADPGCALFPNCKRP